MTPRVMSMCKFVCPDDHWKHYPFDRHSSYVYLGEIVNMPGHGIFLDNRTGRVYSGYHIENFEEIPDEDV